MALSSNARYVLECALANARLAKEVADRADRQAASVAALGALTPAIDQATTNTNLDALQAKVDAVIAALKAAALM